MELLAPQNLPGVGMGDLASLGGIGGLVGLAVTSGALLLARVPGTIVYCIAAVLVLLGNDERWGGQPVVAGVLLAAVLACAVLADVLDRRALSWVALLVGAGAVGYAWAEWNEGAFSGFDTEAIAGTAAGVAAGLVGAFAAHLFLRGSLRAGGSSAIVASTVAVVAFALNSASFYVPFAGYIVLVLAAIVAIRLRRREGGKYKGLRILS